MATNNGNDGTKTAIGPTVTNGAKTQIENGTPYLANVKIKGVASILFHRWNVEAVADKAAAKKGSETKKTDNVESYVYRDKDGFICLPGEYVLQALVTAAKFRQDPRSPRKSAMDLYKAGVVSMTELAQIGPTPTKTWGYLDKRRVQIQRNGITRCRPAFLEGWTAEIMLMVLTPEYIKPEDLLDVLTNAGRLVGVGDYRPSHGRFQVTSFDIGLE